LEIMDFTVLNQGNKDKMNSLRVSLNSLTEERSDDYVLLCEGGTEISFSYVEKEFFSEGDYHFTLRDAKKRLVTIIALKSILQLYKFLEDGRWEIVAHNSGVEE